MAAGRGDLIEFTSATTTGAYAANNVLIFSSGYVDTGAGPAPTTLSGAAAVAGICQTKKAVSSSAEYTKLLVQQSGLATVTVTEDGGATVVGQALALSDSTANLATIIATVGSTAVARPVDPNYLGVVVVAADTTGATTSTATTAAIIRLGIGAR